MANTRIRVEQIRSEAATIGQVLTADGAGGTSWEDASGGGGSEWSVLTNGDAASPELVFAGGDVIMVEIT